MALDRTRDVLEATLRRERGRLLAGLVARFGAGRLELAEDAVQLAVLEALESWSYRGLPDNSGAMLARIAQRRMIDSLRKRSRDTDMEAMGEPAVAPDPVGFEGELLDDELRLLVLCCHPALSGMERLAMPLKMLCGFSASQIASLLLISEDAVAQRLSRGRRKMGQTERETLICQPAGAALTQRLPALLRSLYLQFALGFAPRSGTRLWLAEVCRASLRLCRLLLENPHLKRPDTYALAALICLQIARLPARQDGAGKLVLLRDQDRGLWDPGLLAEGAAHLANAMAGGAMSSYHLEAAIAAKHASAAAWAETDWPGIARLYETLEDMTGSPVVAVNRCVARAMAGDAEGALSRLDALRDGWRGARHYPLELARAEILQQLNRPEAAGQAFSSVLDTQMSEPVRAHLLARQQGLVAAALA